MDLSASAWENRYTNNDTAWDLGEISTPLKTYIDQLEDKSLKILIPGGGNSYEAAYLYNEGFKNVYVVDVSKSAIANLKKRVPNLPEAQLICGNFFDVEDTFDLILEQTFFCAINPVLRAAYILKMKELLAPKGKLVGLLFNVPLFENRPPFGGSKAEYLTAFKAHFTIDKMETCYNSHKSRKGRELFIKLVK